MLTKEKIQWARAQHGDDLFREVCDLALAEWERREKGQTEESTDSVGDWQCKDFADGWITFPDRKAAEQYQEATGALMRYVSLYKTKESAVVQEPDPARPRVVCLCGSSRFFKEWQQAEFDETMAGRIYLSIGFYPHGPVHGEGVSVTPEQKIALDELHKRKIDLADEILVINIGGYIGESTKSEIAYACAHHKTIRWLDPSCIPSGYSTERVADSEQDANVPLPRMPESAHADTAVPTVLRVADPAPTPE